MARLLRIECLMLFTMSRPEAIAPHHLSEAIQYRTLDRGIL
jgi:hypothetical protein